jgi:hypothetical protein
MRIYADSGRFGFGRVATRNPPADYTYGHGSSRVL